MNFYVGLDDLYYAYRFDRSFINVGRLASRRSHFAVNRWIMDSGAFTQISQHGRFLMSTEEYASEIERWRHCGDFEMAVCQDYMCEPHILEITGKTVREHQRLTIERYDRLREATTAPLMPVLQGFKPEEYRECLAEYGDRLRTGARVGVGSVCKRNSHPQIIEYILRGIKQDRPDLRLHGFGLKLTALHRPEIRALLYSADSMAWSQHERKQAQVQRLSGEPVTHSAHDWRKADAYRSRIEEPSLRLELWSRAVES